MHNIHQFAARALLAFALLAGAQAAVAGPTYQVSLDTSAFAGSSGNLDFVMLAPIGALGASATLSHFTGALGSHAEVNGAVAGALPGTVVFQNTGDLNELFQGVDFGGVFHFDLNFGGDFASMTGLDGSTFGIAIFNAAGDAYLGADGNILTFSLMSGHDGVASSVSYDLGGRLAQVAVVPEPADWLSMGTGLALMGFVARRRKAGAVR